MDRRGVSMRKVPIQAQVISALEFSAMASTSLGKAAVEMYSATCDELGR